MSDKTSGGKIDDDAWYGDAVDRPETLHVGAIHYDIEMDVAHLIAEQRESERRGSVELDSFVVLHGDGDNLAQSR